MGEDPPAVTLVYWNRAVTLYEFTDAQVRSGHDLILRDRETGETQLVRFL